MNFNDMLEEKSRRELQKGYWVLFWKILEVTTHKIALVRSLASNYDE